MKSELATKYLLYIRRTLGAHGPDARVFTKVPRRSPAFAHAMLIVRGQNMRELGVERELR